MLKKSVLATFLLFFLLGVSYGQRRYAGCGGCPYERQQQRLAMGSIRSILQGGSMVIKYGNSPQGRVARQKAVEYWNSPEGRTARQTAGTMWRNYRMTGQSQDEAQRRARERYMDRMATRAVSGYPPSNVFRSVRTPSLDANTRIREAQDRERTARANSQEALDRMRERSRAGREAILSGRSPGNSFREASRAVTDYTRSVIEAGRARREAREAGRAAREVREAIQPRDKGSLEDWRDRVREQYDRRSKY